jgi:hypothetical protein
MTKLHNPIDKKIPAYISANVQENEIVMYEKGVLQGTGLRILHFIKNVVNVAHIRLHGLSNPLDHSSNIPQGHLMDADSNGLPHDSGITTSSVNNIVNASSGTVYHIENGINITVETDNQYLIKDHLIIENTGHLILQGDAQLKIFS